MEMLMFDTMRKMMLVGLGVQEKAREMLDDMVDKGKISREEGDSLLNSFMGQAESSVDTMETKFKELLNSALASMDLPTKKDMQELRDQVALLQKTLDKIQGGQG
jgi:polyhydroxyalkanoate synthesis regulator phasin